MPPCRAIVAGITPPINVNGFNDVSFITTSTGYLADVTPPSGQTAQGMVDALSPPGLAATGQTLATTISGLRSDLTVQSINICVAPHVEAGCGPYPPPSPPSTPTESSGAAAAGGAGAAALAMATACAVVMLRGAF